MSRSVSTRRLSARTLRDAFFFGIVMPLGTGAVGTGIALLITWCSR